MSGKKHPIVFFPRYTSLVGAPSDDYRTLPIDVTKYSGGSVSIWRGPFVGTAGAISFHFRESDDRTTWTACTGKTVGGDPGEESELLFEFDTSRRWLRCDVALSGTDVSVLCWASGYLIRREI